MNERNWQIPSWGRNDFLASDQNVDVGIVFDLHTKTVRSTWKDQSEQLREVPDHIVNVWGLRGYDGPSLAKTLRQLDLETIKDDHPCGFCSVKDAIDMKYQSVSRG